MTGSRGLDGRDYRYFSRNLVNKGIGAAGIPYVIQSPNWSSAMVRPEMGHTVALWEKGRDFEFHPAQAEIFRSNAEINVIAKGRRFGLTRGFAYYIVRKMLEGVSPVLWVDTVYKNIDRYVERYFLPLLKDVNRKEWRWRQGVKTLVIRDAVCDFRSADRPENMEGFGYRLIILNEAGIILKNDYLWQNAIRPMSLDYSARVFIGGTPKGKGLFYTLYREAGEREGWKAFHYTSFDNPHLKRGDVEKMAAEMADHVKRQEIYAEFLEGSDQVFRNVSGCIGGELSEPVPGETYHAGLDLAKHNDWTVLIIADSKNHVVFFGRMQHHSWPLQKRWVAENVSRYKARMLVDCTGVGDAIFDDLKRGGLDVAPYRFTAESKQRLIETLMIAIDQGTVTYPDIKVVVDELNDYIYETTVSGFRYNARSGRHDDCVIALALANWQYEGRIGGADMRWL